MQRSAEKVRDARRRELIGLHARIVASGDDSLVELEGRIVDETRNTFVLSCPDGRERRVGKKGQTFSLAFPEGPAVVPGEELNHAPHQRIKKTR